MLVMHLGLEQMNNNITIGFNLKSKKLGTKGIIKIADKFFCDDEINRIAVVAPNVKLNIIRDYEVVEKREVKLPDELRGIVKCANPKCITNNEPMPHQSVARAISLVVRLMTNSMLRLMMS